ncbi:hypothetical protein R4Z10_09695 [Niallia sp. XMNu-256]|uniref:hypothetical protein n=1 Tax=Niallia sp. XMNu-256 TaxID=3082444 RepID=UPI0030D34AD6
MADMNKRNDNDTGKSAGTELGAFTGDTMPSALDPFGSVAVEGAVSGGPMGNKAGKDNVNDNNHNSQTRDQS